MSKTKINNKKAIIWLEKYLRYINYLGAAQLYLKSNFLLRKELSTNDIKDRILGHWGSVPNQNFIYAHLDYLISKHKCEILYLSGPGHGAPGPQANIFAEGTMQHFYKEYTRDEKGTGLLCRDFSWPGAFPSHTTPKTPGMILEGGELGYSLSTAFGAVFDNPDLIAACVIGDGEAETGPLAGSWHSNKFLNPATDGAVLPILHLNGYKIANPTILARIPPEELASLFDGYGYATHFVEGDDPATMHREMATTMDTVVAEIRSIRREARTAGNTARPRWPMIILKTPKGWTGPKTADGKQTEGTWRSHQVPFGDMAGKPDHLRLLEEWMKEYRPEELFDDGGRLRAELAALSPEGNRRMGANPHANGGLLLKELAMPDYRADDVPAPRPGETP